MQPEAIPIPPYYGEQIQCPGNGVRTVMKWISVQEKYPDEAGDYLVSGGGKVWIATFMKLMNIHGFCNSYKNPIIEAWMPFPEPFNKESK